MVYCDGTKRRRNTDAKLMKILIIEDDINDCNEFINCVKNRNDIEIVALTDSDIESLKYVKIKHLEGIVLDLELIGLPPKMVGRKYLHYAIMYLIQNENSDTNVI